MLLVLVFLGFGILLGNVARSAVSDSLASARAPLRVVLPATHPAPTSGSTSSESSTAESSASASGAEAPQAAPEATPAPETSSNGSAPAASSPSSSGASEDGAKGSGSEGGSAESGAAPAKKLPPVKHVFVIMLSDEPYASVFGPSSTAPYLSGTLEHKGELLVRYDAVAHEELAERGGVDQRPGTDR